MASCREVLRPLPGDLHRATRLGGEEFAVLLPGLDANAARGVAELLRLRVAAIPGTIDCVGLEVSASIGIADLRSHQTLDRALESADIALYEAKSGGRNQVVSRAA